MIYKKLLFGLKFCLWNDSPQLRYVIVGFGISILFAFRKYGLYHLLQCLTVCDWATYYTRSIFELIVSFD